MALAATVIAEAPPPSAGPSSGPPPLLNRRISRLKATIMPVLASFGEADEVSYGLYRLSRTGTGADRQRRLLAAAGSPRAFVESLAEVCLPVTSTD